MKIVIAFLCGDEKSFPMTGDKIALKKPLGRVLQLIQKKGGQLPPPPPKPTDQERGVVVEYGDEQKRIEQEENAKAAAENGDAQSRNDDTATDLPALPIVLPPIGLMLPMVPEQQSELPLPMVPEEQSELPPAHPQDLSPPIRAPQDFTPTPAPHNLTPPPPAHQNLTPSMQEQVISHNECAAGRLCGMVAGTPLTISPDNGKPLNECMHCCMHSHGILCQIRFANRANHGVNIPKSALSPKGQTKFDSDIATICNLSVEKLNDPAAANGSDEMVTPIDEDLSSHPTSLLKTARSSAPVLHEAHGPKRKRAKVPTTVYDSVKPTRKHKKNVRLEDL